MIVVTPIPRNVKEAFVTTTVVSCHTDDQTITQSSDHRKGRNPNRPSQRLHLQPQKDLTTEEPQGYSKLFVWPLGGRNTPHALYWKKKSLACCNGQKADEQLCICSSNTHRIILPYKEYSSLWGLFSLDARANSQEEEL